MHVSRTRSPFMARLALAACVGLSSLLSGCSAPEQATLKIGVLHAKTGTMAANEIPLIDAVQMAVDELNAQGGVLGQNVEAVIVDTESDPAVAAQAAETLIRDKKVSALFGCWTSTCRKAVKTVVEKHNHLLVYPVQYEGLEQSPNILYTGATANQQIIPGAYWAIQNLGKRVFLVGSDYVFPRVANQIIHDVAQVNNATVVGEVYKPLENSNFEEVAETIRHANPDVILNTVNGSSNLALFGALQRHGLSKIPVVSFSIDASNLTALAPFGHDRHYAVWGYFQKLTNAQNQKWLAAWQAREGTGKPATDAIEAAYVGVKLWAQAVKSANSTDLSVVNLALSRQSINAPSGILAIDSDTRHLWKPVRIAKVLPDATFEIVYDQNETLRPTPFPGYRTHNDWNAIAERIAAPPPGAQP